MIIATGAIPLLVQCLGSTSLSAQEHAKDVLQALGASSKNHALIHSGSHRRIHQLSELALAAACIGMALWAFERISSSNNSRKR